eukprot:s1162_g11.t1
MKAMKTWSDSETLVLGQQSPRSPRSPRPELRRSKASANLEVSPSASPKTPVKKPVLGSPKTGHAKASPSKSANTIPRSKKGSVGMASPKPKAVQKGQSKGSLAKAKGKCAMRKPAASEAGSKMMLREMEKEKAAKWHEQMCEIRSEWEDAANYNRSFKDDEDKDDEDEDEDDEDEDEDEDDDDDDEEEEEEMMRR